MKHCRTWSAITVRLSAPPIGWTAQGAAALRYFTFKIEFVLSTAPQRVRTFFVEPLGGNPSLLDGAMAYRLDALTQLCPRGHKKSPLAADLSEGGAATLRP